MGNQPSWIVVYDTENSIPCMNFQTVLLWNPNCHNNLVSHLRQEHKLLIMHGCMWFNLHNFTSAFVHHKVLMTMTMLDLMVHYFGQMSNNQSAKKWQRQWIHKIQKLKKKKHPFYCNSSKFLMHYYAALNREEHWEKLDRDIEKCSECRVIKIPREKPVRTGMTLVTILICKQPGNSTWATVVVGWSLSTHWFSFSFILEMVFVLVVHIALISWFQLLGDFLSLVPLTTLHQCIYGFFHHIHAKIDLCSLW